MQEGKYVSRIKQLYIVFSSPDFPDKELHVVQRYCKVTQEGSRDSFFSFPIQCEENESIYNDTQPQDMPHHNNAVHKQGYFCWRMSKSSGMRQGWSLMTIMNQLLKMCQWQELVSHKQNSSNFCQAI
eukprot:8154732-Ditylum_brightwellii.AAC.1